MRDFMDFRLPDGRQDFTDFISYIFPTFSKARGFLVVVPQKGLCLPSFSGLKTTIAKDMHEVNYAIYTPISPNIPSIKPRISVRFWSVILDT